MFRKLAAGQLNLVIFLWVRKMSTSIAGEYKGVPCGVVVPHWWSCNFTWCLATEMELLTALRTHMAQKALRFTTFYVK